MKYLQKINREVRFNVEPQPCPYGDSKNLAVCDPHGKIFNKHVAEWAGPARSLPLEGDYPASEKGSRKPFGPGRKGIFED